MRKDRETFLDEDVLRIQNEVRRYNDEQKGIYDGDGNDKMQRSDGTRTNSDSMSDKSRSNFLQDAPAATQRQ